MRELERRARAVAEADDPQPLRARARRGRGLHPDQQEAVSQLSDVFASAVGGEVEVAPAGTGYRVQLSFDSLDEALALARRLGVRAVA